MPNVTWPYPVGTRVRRTDTTNVRGLGTVTEVVENTCRVRWDSTDRFQNIFYTRADLEIVEAAPAPAPTFRVGDRVRGRIATHWTGTVTVLDLNSACVFVRWDHNPTYDARNRIENLTPEPATPPTPVSRGLVVGDRVRGNVSGRTGTVTCVVDSERVVIRWDTSIGEGSVTELRNLLTRIEQQTSSMPVPRSLFRVGDRVVIDRNNTRDNNPNWTTPGVILSVDVDGDRGTVQWDGAHREYRVRFSRLLHESGRRPRRPQVKRTGPRPPKAKKPCQHNKGTLTTASGGMKCVTCLKDVPATMTVNAR